MLFLWISCPSKVIFLSADEITAINIYAVTLSGEPHGFNNESLLESSANAPKHYCLYQGCDNVLMLGAVLAESLTRNHIYRQGNKRTALAAMQRLIEINGWEIYCPDDDGWLADLIEDLSTKKITREELFEQISFCAIPYGSEEEPDGFEPFVGRPFEPEPFVAEPFVPSKFDPSK